jgi:hypothetical protein
MKRLLATLVLAAAVPVCGGAHAAETPTAEAFEQANAAFAAGRYDEAAAAYRALAERTPQAADVYFNLGNAEAHAGRLGPAVWAFEQALVLDPADDDALHNLESVRQSALHRGLSASGGDQRFILPGDDDVGTGLLTALTPTTATYGFVGFWGAMFGLMIAVRQGRRRGVEDTRQTVLTLGAVTAALGALAFGALLAGRILIVREATYGIVVAEKGQVQAGPGEQYRTVARVMAGVKLRLRGEDTDWFHVVLPDGATGWVKRTEIARLRSG